MIPENTKREILEYAGNHIVEILQEYIPSLRKDRNAFKACCPFHEEKTPSFSVDPGRKTWRCFGACSEGGDAVKFLMKHESISFPAALERIARRGGIIIPTGESKEEKERKALVKIMGKAQRFYRDNLEQNTNGPRAYVGTRMTDEMVKLFGLGFAPVGGKALLEYLQKEKIPLDLAEKVGLICKDDNNRYRDLFSGRLMFPIRDINNATIAFAGRVLGKSEVRKYINSPETPLYKKKSTLYGLDMAIDPMKLAGEGFVVEGYTDLISMRAADIQNVVATCGTAFTKEQAVILKRYVKCLNLMFDGDDAGRKALERSVLLAMKEELKTKVFIFPEGEDPDSYFKKGGKVEDLHSMSGLEFLDQSGVSMSTTLKELYRLERLERGFIYIVQKVPAAARILGARKGGLDELFALENIPLVEGIISGSK